MLYKDLNLKLNKEINIAKVGDIEIEVLKYLPIQDKNDLIEIALQKAEQNGIYNEMKLDMYFNLFVIYMYTNIEFTPEQKEDEYTLYNELESNGVINAVIGAMQDQEWDLLTDYLDCMKENFLDYKRSTSALIQSLIQDLPKNAAAAAQIVQNFDTSKYQEVVEFAKKSNNNNPVPLDKIN